MAKIPPPTGLATTDPVFNRWLLELTSILNGGGGIDPTTIAGLTALVAQVAANTAAIASLSGQVGTLSGQVSALNTAVTSLGTRTTAAEAAIVVLQARSQVFNGTGDPLVGLGVNGDWYARTDTPNRGTFVKVAGAWARVSALF